jgi:serine/threonine protein kinase
VVFDYYEYSLSYFFRKMNKRIEFEVIMKMGMELIVNIKILHDLGYSHSDMKPSNLMLNKGSNDIFIIDFGLAEKLGFENRKRFVGTPYYSATNHLKRGPIVKKDDLEAILYIVLYLIKGDLPWTRNVPVPSSENTPEELKLLNEIFEARRPELLCEGMDIEFSNYLKYLNDLD